MLIKEYAELNNMSPSKVRRMAASGKIKAEKVPAGYDQAAGCVLAAHWNIIEESKEITQPAEPVENINIEKVDSEASGWKKEKKQKSKNPLQYLQEKKPPAMVPIMATAVLLITAKALTVIYQRHLSQS